MFGFDSPRQGAGRSILARAINRPADSIARQARGRPGGKLAQFDAAGTPLTYSTTRPTWLVRITTTGTGSQAGQYGWQAVYPVVATENTFADDPGLSGSLAIDPLFEINSTSTLAVGDRVEVTRDYDSGKVIAQYAHC